MKKGVKVSLESSHPEAPKGLMFMFEIYFWMT